MSNTEHRKILTYGKSSKPRAMTHNDFDKDPFASTTPPAMATTSTFFTMPDQPALEQQSTTLKHERSISSRYEEKIMIILL